MSPDVYLLQVTTVQDGAGDTVLQHAPSATQGEIPAIGRSTYGRPPPLFRDFSPCAAWRNRDTARG